MAKQVAIQSGVILLVIAVATALSNYGLSQVGKGQDIGILKACVENNTANILRLDKEGSQELKNTTQRMAILETMLNNITEDMKEDRADMKELKTFLMKP